jgi:hypothetical protein
LEIWGTTGEAQRMWQQVTSVPRMELNHATVLSKNDIFLLHGSQNGRHPEDLIAVAQRLYDRRDVLE